MSSNLSNPSSDLLFLVAQNSRLWRRVVNQSLQSLGFTEAMWLPLLHLARSDEAPRQKDLALSLSLDSSSVVRLLEGLESAGLVVRSPGRDRRAKTIELTPLGRETADSLEARIGPLRRQVLSSVPQEDLAHAFKVLKRLSEAMAEYDVQP